MKLDQKAGFTVVSLEKSDFSDTGSVTIPWDKTLGAFVLVDSRVCTPEEGSIFMNRDNCTLESLIHDVQFVKADKVIKYQGTLSAIFRDGDSIDSVENFKFVIFETFKAFTDHYTEGAFSHI